jgi:hypothetical protein
MFADVLAELNTNGYSDSSAYKSVGYIKPFKQMLSGEL